MTSRGIVAFELSTAVRRMWLGNTLIVRCLLLVQPSRCLQTNAVVRQYKLYAYNLWNMISALIIQGIIETILSIINHQWINYSIIDRDKESRNQEHNYLISL